MDAAALVAGDEAADEIAIRGAMEATLGAAEIDDDVLCLSGTTPGMSGLMSRAIDQLHKAIPSAQFVIGGRSLSAPPWRQLRAANRSGRVLRFSLPRFVSRPVGS